MSEGTAANAKVRQIVRDTHEERKRQQEADIRHVLGSPQGQRFAAWLVDTLGMYREGFAESPRQSAFYEGQKSVGVLIRREAMKCEPRFWHAIEDAVQARQIKPTNAPIKESDDE